MALKTLRTRNTLASNTPMFCTMSGMMKSMRLEATMAVSGRESEQCVCVYDVSCSMCVYFNVCG